MTPTLIPFTIESYDKVMELWKSSTGVGLSDADSKRNITVFLERNEGLSLLAVIDTEVVGSILIGHDGRRGYLHHLAVSASFRRQGVGTELVLAGLNNLKDCGIGKCHLFVFDANTSAKKFWGSLGWTYREDLSVFSRTIS